ncbi:helix-turn-helix domain-containing protein [Qipengyuania sp. 1NDH17]|uniref:Helix-turn-helix domain-containing protein n=1 Tax=Qipengyuania polymorpha TaxID=2867234 RepID=A0ABS7IZM5_9SPHN|nr:helix-turn-helix domain-containing protein [Qipengyuania polymorpha]
MAKGFHDDRYRVLIADLVSERKARGWSQRELAECIGRHQQFVSRYETGERRLDVIEYFDICFRIGFDPMGIVYHAMGRSMDHLR